MCASIAQLAEQRTFNPWVRGSIPRGGTLPSPAGGGLSVERDWCPQRAVNSPPSGMGGSIPSRRTHCHLRVRAEAPSLSDDGSPASGQGSTRWCNWQARPALVREATGSSPVRVARHSLRGGKAEVPMLFDNRMRPSGEIGRRAGFRIQYPPGCPSSSLGAGTGQLAVRVRGVEQDHSSPMPVAAF